MKKAIPWLGMSAAVVYVIGVLLGGALIGSTYNHMVHAISEIDIMIPRDLRPITSSVFALYGVGLFLFGAGAFIYGRERHKPLVNIALLALALNAASGLLMGFFPQDPRDATPTFQGTVHLVLAGFSALFSVLSPLLVGIASVRTPGSRRLGWYSIVSSIIIFLSGGVTAAAAANQFPYFGLVERVTIGTFIVWVFVYATWLWSSKERSRSGVETTCTGTDQRLWEGSMWKSERSTSPVIRVFSLLVILATVSAVEGSPLPQNDLGSQIDHYLTRVERERGLDAAVLIAQGDEAILRKGYGIADDAGRTPFSADTVVGIGSISKQFTAAAIMRLVDQGRLSVEDTLGEWLPGVPADKAGITLHQLLTHTSGLKSDHMESDLEPLTKQEALDRILSSELRSKPGERYSYSNSGYTLLAAVVEQASGQEHDAFLRNEFFDPLGMDKTGNWADPRFDVLQVSTGYMNGESSGPIHQIPGPYWTVIGNGGIISTVDDMLTWYKALHGGQVLSAESTAAIFTSYTAGDGRDIEYGYGWEVSERPGLGRLISHNGGGLTGNSILSDYLDQNLTIVILGNRITYQTLGPIPLVVRLPADETCRAIAAGVASGDLSKLPTATFVIWPYLGSLVGALVLVVAALSWVRQRVRASRRTKR